MHNAILIFFNAKYTQILHAAKVFDLGVLPILKWRPEIEN